MTVFMGFVHGLSLANTLDTLKVSKPVIEPNETLDISVSIKKTADSAWCGAILELGDGRDQLIRFGLNPDDLSQVFKYTFPKPGNYSITLRGRAMLRGLKSAVACDGSKSVAVLVQEKKPEPVVNEMAKISVSAKVPQTLNPPIDQNRYIELLNTNPDFKRAIDAYSDQKQEAVGLLTILAEAGEPYAQLFLGLAYENEWSKVSNLKASCSWLRKSAEAGVSQARLFFAHRALQKNKCFDVEPTLEEADVWVKLAGQSNDATVKSQVKVMEDAILKIRLGIK